MDKKNNYKVSEQDIIATVNDFIGFCCFIDERKPLLSKRKVGLGKNDLFELNTQLNFRKDVAAPNYQQESYPIIDLMFKLAVLGKLYLKVGDPKGNVYLETTTRKTEFDALNSFEKYCFLFETFWTQYDFMEIIRWGNNPIHEIIQTLAKSRYGQQLKKGSFSGMVNYDPAFSYNSIIIQYFSYLGICTLVPIVYEAKKRKTYDDIIEEVIPTEFGVNICKILTKQKITDWNIPWLEIHGYYNDEEEKENEPEIIPLFKYFVPMFPKGVLSNTVNDETKKLAIGSFIFKVSLESKVWRKIRLSSKHSLEDLHLAIQEAFEFDNDHLYSFFMDGKRYSRNAYHSPFSDEGPYAYDAIIGELELYLGQKILYLFDYGDSWQFAIQLMKIEEDELLPETPEVIEIMGDAPKQY
jgi:hypothetical protein